MGAAIAAVALLASCSSSPAAEAPKDGGSDAAVVYTHPTLDGLEISFDKTPEVIIMDCYAYSSFHEYGIEPDALFGYDCENPFVMGDIDTSGLPFVGKDGEINIEKVAELRPDVIIGQGTADGWNWFSEDVNAQLTRVASFVALPGGDTVDDRIANTRGLAEFLGANTEADEIVKADADLEEAKKAFESAIEDKGLSIMLASPSKESLYTAVSFVQANLLEELGATIVGGEPPASGNPWGVVAWEDASSYPADIILAEGFSENFDFSTELWDVLPAVKANQLGAWGSKGAMTSRAYADWLNDVADLVTSSDKVTS